MSISFREILASRRGGIASVWLVLLALVLAPRTGHAAGGAFAVDDVEIGKPGDCKVESWASFATNHDLIFAAAPACVANLGIPVELGAQMQRSRADGVWGTSGTLKGKANIIPVEGRPFGLGIAGGSTWNLLNGANTGGFINVPVTFRATETLRINVNGGWLYDNVAKIHYATWGAGFEWSFMKPFTLIGEVYGQYGRLPAVEEDAPPAPNSIRQPKAQIGLRVTPKDNIDVDVIWGHNITGENAQWVTLGLNLRF